MTKVFLHGALRERFGKEFKFHINSAKEALLAINSNRRGFLEEVKRLGSKGVQFHIIMDGAVAKDIKEFDVRRNISEIHIIPALWGAGKGLGIFKVFLAVVLIIISVLFKPAAPFLLPIAAGLLVSGIMDLMYPPPKPNFEQEVQAGAKSYLFGNRYNNTAQGQAVPVGYGRLKIGSSQISAAVNHYSLRADVKQLMTPVDKPINDYIELRFDNEIPDSSDGLIQDSFYTNQSADLDKEPDSLSAMIVNSYVDIVSKNSVKVSSGPVEVVVRKNGEIISNVNLENFNDNVEYQWSVVSQNAGTNKIKIEYPYAFQDGLVYRTYHPANYKLRSNLNNIESIQEGYFTSYKTNTLVKYGPTQFRELQIGNWDYSHRYYSGQLVKYPTGTETEVYFQAIVTGTGGSILGFDSTDSEIPTNPTGVGDTVRTDYWRKIIPPTIERTFKSLTDFNTGELPSRGPVEGNSPYWQGLVSPENKTEFDELINNMPNFRSQGVYNGVIEQINEKLILRQRESADNYAMEFMGYLYIPVVENLKKQVPDTTPGVMYEILKVGATGQWSGIGLTGAGGFAIPPRRGLTFVKNSTQSNGDGICYPVVKYNFKIDSDDAADLHIDGMLASSYYGDHGFSGVNKTAAQLADPTVLPSTSGELLLTAGYHHLYARFQETRGEEGISFYYQYDTNWDGDYSDFISIPANRLKHREFSDVEYPVDAKFLPRAFAISAQSMVSGRQYKILNLGSVTNWAQMGASSPRVGTIFTKINNTAPNQPDGFVFEDTYNYAESKASEGNRVVQFSAQRPIRDGAIDNGYSDLESKYNCKVTLDGITVSTSPVRIKVKFLNSSIPRNGIVSSVLPIENYEA